MVDHKCENCGCIHQVKSADLKRGWGKTCSKSCAASIKARKPGSNYKKYINRARRGEEQDEDMEGLEEGWDGHKD